MKHGKNRDNLEREMRWERKWQTADENRTIIELAEANVERWRGQRPP